ncbi:MAG: hypothetical protein A2Y94_09760 [Caldithrix sp. RBG_13_44_9]|nr:MAG: hypothetical protein A2Y94_09760 [Caldithrix sp. RBG_13_44_9]
MGKIKAYPPVKFFAAMTFAPTAPIDEAQRMLESLLAEIEEISFCYDFDQFTHYYGEEMGTNLKKKVLSFRQLKPAELLPEIKIATNEIEHNFLDGQGRQINLDPGYVSAARMVLATTKDYDHRIYLNRGIFADLHLRFRQGHFQPTEWTYPDYRQPELIDYFERIRNSYLEQLKDWHLS